MAFHHVVGHAPTEVEWIQHVECPEGTPREELVREIHHLVREGMVQTREGRYAYDASLIQRVRDREAWLPRKRRVVCRVASWLARLSSVRFVGLCNSTAFGTAEERSDLDFFIITRAGKIMTTRGLAVFPYRLLKRRPTEERGERDAVCLSYFISDAELSLASHMLSPDDPYFRYWFLTLVPIYDDGVGTRLWEANRHITSKHPFATKWDTSPDLCVKPRIRVPVPSFLETPATSFQRRRFPSTIRERMNQDSRVLVSPTALKFHTNDRRGDFRNELHQFCHTKNISL